MSYVLTKLFNKKCLRGSTLSAYPVRGSHTESLIHTGGWQRFLGWMLSLTQPCMLSGQGTSTGGPRLGSPSGSSPKYNQHKPLQMLLWYTEQNRGDFLLLLKWTAEVKFSIDQSFIFLFFNWAAGCLSWLVPSPAKTQGCVRKSIQPRNLCQTTYATQWKQIAVATPDGICRKVNESLINWRWMSIYVFIQGHADLKIMKTDIIGTFSLPLSFYFLF